MRMERRRRPLGVLSVASLHGGTSGRPALRCRARIRLGTPSASCYCDCRVMAVNQSRSILRTRAPAEHALPPSAGYSPRSTQQAGSVRASGLAVGTLRPPIGELARAVSVPAEGTALNAWLRAIDVGLALTALAFLSPLLLLIAVSIKLDSRGPVFYRQVRVGLDQRRLGAKGAGRRAEDRGDVPASRPDVQERRQPGKRRGRRVRSLGGAPFIIYKFRTMHVGAEKATGPVWATHDDHRVTRVGHWLRRFRLDELAQCWNVLRGDMSIVGPRPERPAFVERLHRELAAYGLRQRVRPGITGLAQVNRGPDQNIDDVRVKLAYDLEYINSRSLRLNLRIMLRTVPAALRLSRRA